MLIAASSAFFRTEKTLAAHPASPRKRGEENTTQWNSAGSGDTVPIKDWSATR
jgi:hypothetical protein